MTSDERRRAAEEWALSKASGDSMSAATIRAIASESHLAGQDAGEKRGYDKAIAEIVTWLRKLAIHETFNADVFDEEKLAGARSAGVLAASIARGEHRGGENG